MLVTVTKIPTILWLSVYMLLIVIYCVYMFLQMHCPKYLEIKLNDNVGLIKRFY